MAPASTIGLRRAQPDELLAVTDHLDELRRRLILCVVTLVVAVGGMYPLHTELIAFLSEPLPDRVGPLVTLSPTEPFLTTLKVVFYAGLIVSLPIWLYQLYAFVIPAVTTQSRRMTIAVVSGLSGLFIAGVAFGYLIVLPVALDFLTGFGAETFRTDLRAGEYFGFATSLLLATGLIFEVPVAMAALARLGVVTAKAFRTNWRIAIVVIAVVAAVLPGGDPFSMFLLMLPQMVLYVVGIGLASRFERPVPDDESDPS